MKKDDVEYLQNVKNKSLLYLSRFEQLKEFALEKNMEIKENSLQKLVKLQKRNNEFSIKMQCQVILLEKISFFLQERYKTISNETNLALKQFNYVITELNIFIKQLKEKEIDSELLETSNNGSNSFEKKTLFHYINYEDIQKLTKDSKQKISDISDPLIEFGVLVDDIEEKFTILKKRTSECIEESEKNKTNDIKNIEDFNNERISNIKGIISDIFTIIDNLQFLEQLPKNFEEKIFLESEQEINKILQEIKNSEYDIRKRHDNNLEIFHKMVDVHGLYENFNLMVNHFNKKINGYEVSEIL
jgi:hypothetical protein